MATICTFIVAMVTILLADNKDILRITMIFGGSPWYFSPACPLNRNRTLLQSSSSVALFPVPRLEILRQQYMVISSFAVPFEPYTCHPPGNMGHLPCTMWHLLVPYNTFLAPCDTFLAPCKTFLAPSDNVLAPYDPFVSFYNTFLAPKGLKLVYNNRSEPMQKWQRPE